MDRVRLDELMRTWLHTLARSPDTGVAAMASCALELHDALSADGPMLDRPAAAARYVNLIETLMASGARPATRGDPREAVAGKALASRKLHRFWGRALENLKAHCEASNTPPIDPAPRKRS